MVEKELCCATFSEAPLGYVRWRNPPHNQRTLANRHLEFVGHSVCPGHDRPFHMIKRRGPDGRLLAFNPPATTSVAQLDGHRCQQRKRVSDLCDFNGKINAKLEHPCPTLSASGQACPAVPSAESGVGSRKNHPGHGGESPLTEGVSPLPLTNLRLSLR